MSISETKLVETSPPRPRLPLANRLMKLAAITALLLMAFASSCALTFSTIGKDMKQPITEAIPPGFPVLVFWYQDGSSSLQAKVIPIEELQEHRKDHPNTFFMLPEGRGDELQARLREQAELIDGDIQKQYKTGRVMRIGARIESSDQAHQSWRVRFQHGNDHVNIGYYTASKESVQPTHIERFFGPALALRSLPLDLAGWVLIWAIAGFGSYALSRLRSFNAAKWASNVAMPQDQP